MLCSILDSLIGTEQHTPVLVEYRGIVDEIRRLLQRIVLSVQHHILFLMHVQIVSIVELQMWGQDTVMEEYVSSYLIVVMHSTQQEHVQVMMSVEMVVDVTQVSVSV